MLKTILEADLAALAKVGDKNSEQGGKGIQVKN